MRSLTPFTTVFSFIFTKAFVIIWYFLICLPTPQSGSFRSSSSQCASNSPWQAVREWLNEPSVASKMTTVGAGCSGSLEEPG